MLILKIVLELKLLESLVVSEELAERAEVVLPSHRINIFIRYLEQQKLSSRLSHVYVSHVLFHDLFHGMPELTSAVVSFFGLPCLLKWMIGRLIYTTALITQQSMCIVLSNLLQVEFYVGIHTIDNAWNNLVAFCSSHYGSLHHKPVWDDLTWF